MKNSIFLFLLIVFFSFCPIQAQQSSTIGLQWSSARLGYNRIPFEGFNMGSEIAAYGFFRLGKYLILSPEMGLMQQNISYVQGGGWGNRFTSRFVHTKVSVIFPFRKSFHSNSKGWFASIGFSQNRQYSTRFEVKRSGSTVWEEADPDPGSESGFRQGGDLHIGLGYSLPFARRINLTLRGEYAEGILFDGLRRNEFGLSLGLGWRFED